MRVLEAKPAARLKTAQVLAWRMRRQLVHPVGALELTDTLRTMLGAQAQVQSSAELSIALRRRRGRIGDAATAIAQRTVIRTWAMRGTLHVLEPRQAGALLALLATSRRWERKAWQDWTGVGPRELPRLIEAARDALDDRVLGREELIEEITQRLGSRDLEEHLRSGWGGVLKPLAWLGHICNGPSRGGRVTFTRPDTWVPGWRPVPEPDDAAREVIPAFLAAYGPATQRTFHAWLAREACKSADVKRWFELCADQLATVTVDGEPCFALAQDVDALRETRPVRAVRLLAGIDQYILAPGTADTRIISAHRRPELSRTAGWISPAVVAGGRVIGVWQLKDDRLDVTLFGEERPVEGSALQAECARVGAALRRELTLSVTRA